MRDLHVHLIGIGGAGMSVVAALLAARGATVSGSDARPGPVLDALRERGVTVHEGHDAAVVDALPGTARVVVSTAVRESNPELAAARARGLAVLHRSEALALLMAGRRVVAVAGAHGKTTTSAMLAVALEEIGAEPSFAIGGAVVRPGQVNERGGSLAGAGDGAGEIFVAEADESDGSFLAYEPFVALVTNVEPDHLDHFGSREAFEAAFVEFAQRIRPEGALVVCVDDDGARRLADRVRAAGRVRVVTYGTAGPARPDVALDPRPQAELGSGSVPAAGLGRTGGLVTEELDGDRAATALTLAVPGHHNLLNATGAFAVLRVLGVEASEAARGLAEFRGTARRFEHRGTAGGVRVVDDYAHHPTEVTALVRAARQVAGEGRVLVLFQPHLFSRTAHFAADFAKALSLADGAVVTSVYAAREEPVPGVDGATITRLVPGGLAEHVADGEEAALRVAGLAEPGDLVLTVGAGDVTRLGPVVLEELRRRSEAGELP